MKTAFDELHCLFHADFGRTQQQMKMIAHHDKLVDQEFPLTT